MTATSAAAARPARRAAFLDRDGVINLDHGYVWQARDFDFVPGAVEAMGQLAALGFTLVVVTNQAGIGRGMYTEDDFHQLTHWMRGQLAAAGIVLGGVYYCPHHPTLARGDFLRVCACRKPAPGMLLRAAQELGIDLPGSVMFGDKCDDLRAAQAAGVGCRVLLGTDGRALPADPCADVALDGRYRGLAEALADPVLAVRLAQARPPAVPLVARA